MKEECYDKEIYMKSNEKLYMECVLIQKVELDRLKAEIEQLQQEKAQIIVNALKLSDCVKENKQLREMLRKCDPHGDGRYCVACELLFPNHKPNCEYIKLTNKGDTKQ